MRSVFDSVGTVFETTTTKTTYSKRGPHGPVAVEITKERDRLKVARFIGDAACAFYDRACRTAIAVGAGYIYAKSEDKCDLPDGAATGPPIAPCSGTTGTATPETQGVADEVRQGAAGREESEADSTQHVGGEEWRREESRFPGGHESCEPTTHGPDDIDFEVKSSNPYAPDAGRASSLGYSVASVPDDVLAVSGKSMLGQDETGEPTTSMVRDESLDESPNGEGVPDVGGEAASSAGLGVSFGSRPLGDSFLCSIHA